MDQNISFCLYGHLRRPIYNLINHRYYLGDGRRYIHTWSTYAANELSWHKDNSQRFGSIKVKKNILQKGVDVLFPHCSKVRIDRQDKIQIDNTAKFKFFSALKSIELAKDGIVLLTRPDITFKRRLDLCSMPSKGSVFLSFDLANGKTSSDFIENIGCCDIVVLGHKEDLIKVFETLLKNAYDYKSDMHAMTEAANEHDIHVDLIGFMNERDFFIYRKNNGFRLANIYAHMQMCRSFSTLIRLLFLNIFRGSSS